MNYRGTNNVGAGLAPAPDTMGTDNMGMDHTGTDNMSRDTRGEDNTGIDHTGAGNTGIDTTGMNNLSGANGAGASTAPTVGNMGANKTGVNNTGMNKTDPKVGNIVRAYKSLVSKGCLDLFEISIDNGITPKHEFMGKVWQRNFHEHIIRDVKSYHLIANYILSNPQRWMDDEFFNV